MNNKLEQLLNFLGTIQSPVASSSIQKELHCSQPTISRLLRSAGDRIVRIGHGRSTRYAAAADPFGAGRKIPLFSIDRHGIAVQIATVCPTGGGGFFVNTSTTLPRWLAGDNGTGFYGDLPYFLDDLRPQGFLGRRIARKLAGNSRYPNDPRYWQSHHVGRFLVEEGYDLPGSLLLGDLALDIFHKTHHPVVDRQQFPELALGVLAGPVCGSSAGGEQPKFTTCTVNGHVIVKFSPAGEFPSARRWQDLLVAEHIALGIIGKRGIQTAETQVWRIGDRVFLESKRFDRVGKRGRRPAISLAGIDAEFAGIGSNWIEVAETLAARGLLEAKSAAQITWLQTFGEWIANSDMHLANISLTPVESHFLLCPVYDMVPMLYAPERDELVERPYHPPARTIRNTMVWLDTGKAAVQFWQEVLADQRISLDLKKIAAARVEDIVPLLRQAQQKGA